MNQQFIAALTGAGTAVAVGLTMMVRAVQGPAGRHRATHPQPAYVPLDDLLGPSWSEFEPPYGAVVVQRWGACPTCGQDTPGVIHGDGWQCGQCLTIVPDEGR